MDAKEAGSLTISLIVPNALDHLDHFGLGSNTNQQAYRDLKKSQSKSIPA
jgi:hypothetical protein